MSERTEARWASGSVCVHTVTINRHRPQRYVSVATKSHLQMTPTDCIWRVILPVFFPSIQHVFILFMFFFFLPPPSSGHWHPQQAASHSLFGEPAIWCRERWGVAVIDHRKGPGTAGPLLPSRGAQRRGRAGHCWAWVSGSSSCQSKLCPQLL